MPNVLAARGRPTGRGRPRGSLLHAVPGNDRTRSALCGARVGGETHPWPHLLAAPTDRQPTDRPVHQPPTCPECSALLDSDAA